MRKALVIGYVLWAVSCMVFPSASAQEAPVNIGSNRELFVDHFLVDSLENVRLALGVPEHEDAVLAFDKPWEGRYCGYVTVFQDADRYRMYYRGLPEAGRDGSDNEVTCYAESQDGIHWTKPELDLFAVRDHPLNNVVLAGQAP